MLYPIDIINVIPTPASVTDKEIEEIPVA